MIVIASRKGACVTKYQHPRSWCPVHGALWLMVQLRLLQIPISLWQTARGINYDDGKVDGDVGDALWTGPSPCPAATALFLCI